MRLDRSGWGPGGDIWILWISRVTDGDILDRDAVENHLHSIGAGPQ